MPSSGRSAELKDEVQRLFGLDLPVDDWAKEEGIADEEIKARLNDAVERLFAQKAAQYGPDVWRQVEKSVLMQLFDQSWKDHLLHLDHLRQGIGLRAYGQKDPLNEYKREAFNLFNDLLTGLREQVVSVLATLQLRMEPPPMPEHAGADARGPRGSGAGQRRQRRSRLRPGRSGRRRRRHAAAAARGQAGASTPTIPRPGARSRAMPPAPAARARSSSTATGGYNPSRPFSRFSSLYSLFLPGEAGEVARRRFRTSCESVLSATEGS